MTSITERFAWQPRTVYELGLSAEELGVFCYLSNIATFKPLDLTTRAGTVKLLPGQLYSTIRQLAEKLKVTKDKIARTLKKLAKMALLDVVKTATKAATHGSLLTIRHLTKFPPDGFEGETASATNPRQECDTNSKRETREEDSCGSQAPHQPADDYDPFADDAPRAGAAGAGPSDVPTEPQPKAEAGSPPNSAAPPSRKPARKSRVPEDWTPKPQTHAWALNGTIGAKPEQIAEQLEAFRDHHISKGSTFADFDRAFQTWMRNAKRFGQLDAPRPKFKTKAEEYVL